MYIRSLSLKNYMSFENVELINLEKDKVYIVYGINKDTGGSNGIGKSALLESIPVALYGKTLRQGMNINNIKDLIKKDKNEMFLHIQLSNNIEIERYRTKSKEEVNLKVNNQDIDIRLKTDIDNEIEKYIIPFDTFRYLNYFNPITLQFFSLSPKQRMEILEDILGLNRLSELHKEYKEKLNQVKIELSNLQTKHELLSNEIQNMENTIKNIENENEKIRKEQLKEKYSRILITYENEFLQYKNELESFIFQFKEYVKKYLEYKTKITKVNNIHNIDNEILSLQSILEKVKELEEASKQKICPVCKRPFDDQEHENITPQQYIEENTSFTSKKEIQAKVNELLNIKEEYETYKEHKRNLENLINNIFIQNLKKLVRISDEYYIEDKDLLENTSNILNKIIQFINNKLSNEINIDSYILTFNVNEYIPKLSSKERKEVIIKNIENEIESILTSNKQFIEQQKEKLKQVIQEKESIENKVNELNKVVETLNTLINELSSTGNFRKFIYEKYLSKLENLIQSYIKVLYPTFSIKLSIELKGRNKGINLYIKENGIEKNYANLSSGEKRICDIAFALSLSSFTSDILIIDEALNSLSYEIKLRVIDLLTKLNKQVFLVEHDSNIVDNIKYLYPDKIKVINIIKENSKSYITTN